MVCTLNARVIHICTTHVASLATTTTTTRPNTPIYMYIYAHTHTHNTVHHIQKFSPTSISCCLYIYTYVCVMHTRDSFAYYTRISPTYTRRYMCITRAKTRTYMRNWDLNGVTFGHNTHTHTHSCRNTTTTLLPHHIQYTHKNIHAIYSLYRHTHTHTHVRPYMNYIPSQ